MSEVPKKHALMSKTVWMNFCLAVIAVFSAKFPEAGLQSYLSAENMSLIFAVCNVLLRAISKDKVYFY